MSLFFPSFIFFHSFGSQLLLERLFMMMLKALLLCACGNIALAHSSHDQEPIEGPHKSLWYNTLPGDGGTQVRAGLELEFRSIYTNVQQGRFSFLRHLDFRAVKLSPLSVQGKRRLRHCVYWYAAAFETMGKCLIMLLRCTIRHGDFISTRCPLRAQRNQTRFSPSQSLVCTV